MLYFVLMITVSVVILPQDGGLEGACVYGTLPMMAHHHPSTPWWQVLQEKFSEFASETGTAGRERLAAVNQMVDELIECGHTAAATMAEWKDGLNEAWAELLELMGTRAQLLAASRELHKFFSDARELQGQIEEKRRRLPRLTTPPEPRPSASSMQRTLRAFEHDLQLLVSQVGGWWPGGAGGRAWQYGQRTGAAVLGKIRPQTTLKLDSGIDRKRTTEQGEVI